MITQLKEKMFVAAAQMKEKLYSSTLDSEVQMLLEKQVQEKGIGFLNFVSAGSFLQFCVLTVLGALGIVPWDEMSTRYFKLPVVSVVFYFASRNISQVQVLNSWKMYVVLSFNLGSMMEVMLVAPPLTKFVLQWVIMQGSHFLCKFTFNNKYQRFLAQTAMMAYFCLRVYFH